MDSHHQDDARVVITSSATGTSISVSQSDVLGDSPELEIRRISERTLARLRTRETFRRRHNNHGMVSDVVEERKLPEEMHLEEIQAEIDKLFPAHLIVHSTIINYVEKIHRKEDQIARDIALMKCILSHARTVDDMIYQLSFLYNQVTTEGVVKSDLLSQAGFFVYQVFYQSLFSDLKHFSNQMNNSDAMRRSYCVLDLLCDVLMDFNSKLINSRFVMQQGDNWRLAELPGRATWDLECCDPRNWRWWGFIAGPLAIIAGASLLIAAYFNAPHTLGLSLSPTVIGVALGLIGLGVTVLSLSVYHTWRYGPAYAAHGFLNAAQEDGYSFQRSQQARQRSHLSSRSV